MKETKDKSLLIRMPNSLFLEFEMRCHKEGRTVSDMIRELMFRYLANQWVILPEGKKIYVES
jgi:hypothetical protein